MKKYKQQQDKLTRTETLVFTKSEKLEREREIKVMQREGKCVRSCLWLALPTIIAVSWQGTLCLSLATAARSSYSSTRSLKSASSVGQGSVSQPLVVYILHRNRSLQVSFNKQFFQVK